MRYLHRFAVRAPLAEVAAFHRSLASFRALSPPLVPLSVHQAPEVLGPGDRLDFTLWFGPFPIRWVAELSALQSGEGFLDRQLAGPFASWVHRHRFIAASPSETVIEDRVAASLRHHAGWWSVGVVLWLALPGLFRFRAWRTRRLLARRKASRGSAPAPPPSPRRAGGPGCRSDSGRSSGGGG